MKKIFLILFFLSQSVFAIDLYQPGLTARQNAMGGTSIADSRGVDALFYNPAALTKVDGFALNIVTLSPTISTNAKDLYNKLSGSSNFSAADVNGLYGNDYFTEVAAHGGIVFPYFGVGAYSNNTGLQSFNNPSFPTYHVDFISDYGYVIAGGIPVTNNFSLGIAGRHVHRWAGQKDILVTDLIGSNSKDVIDAQLPDKGEGNALDLSALYTFGGPWNVSLASVWKDVGDTKFKTLAGNGPDHQEDNLMFGVSSQKEIGFMTWTNAFEYDYIRNTGDFTKKLHLGTELSLALFDLRGGVSQGYLTYGAGVNLWFLQIDATAYTGELGASAGQTGNDRYEASISINLDFDQSFKLQAADGKRRRLLQRR